MNTPKKNRPKRFIAGAVCPKCAEMDKIYVYQEERKTFRACISCDFVEEQPDQAALAPIPTRVNRDPNQDNNKKVNTVKPEVSIIQSVTIVGD